MGTLSLARADAAGALKKARELQAEAYMDIRIVDPSGAVLTIEALAGSDAAGPATDAPNPTV